MLCYAMLCYAMLCYAMLCYAMLCYAMLCYAMLCYAMLLRAAVFLAEIHTAVSNNVNVTRQQEADRVHGDHRADHYRAAPYGDPGADGGAAEHRPSTDGGGERQAAARLRGRGTLLSALSKKTRWGYSMGRI